MRAPRCPARGLLVSLALLAACEEAPAPYTRPDVGDPVTEAEIAIATDQYLEILEQRAYLDVVDQRVHGWPRSDARGRFWFGTWWSGVRILRENGRVIFRHSVDGADNNALRTSAFLEGALFAATLWDRPKHWLLLRKLVRGFSSWILAMHQEGRPELETLMARAAYPEPVTSTDGGWEIDVDYAPDRPGVDAEPSQYVHSTTNPYWPDLWVKNRRSKDDLGHVYRAVGLLLLADVSRDAELVDEVAQLAALYQGFSRRVEDDGWAFATIDASTGGVVIPDLSLAHFLDYENAECLGMLGVRLNGRGDAGTLDCGDGIGVWDAAFDLKASNANMLRAWHQGAAGQAAAADQEALYAALRGGLARRSDALLDRLLGDNPPENPSPGDMAEFLVGSAALGLPLTSREVRYLHERLAEAHASYLDPATDSAYRVFAPDAPDGEYAFDPPGSGLFFRTLGQILGVCASPLRSTTGKPVIDCARVRDWVAP